mmetsp:Transcript_757/g.1112  ORF Transcript_757/g.1112 Transcript_757/m.1112 type:complete len:371 (-) Transcript_757:15-1127(-)
MHVFDSRGTGFMRFDSKLTRSSELGHVVEHKTVQSSLFERMEQLSKENALDLRCPAELVNIDFSPTIKEPAGPMKATLKDKENGSLFEANVRLLVGADGKGSKVQRLRGISNWGWGYGQRAVVTIVKLSPNSNNETAWQRFLPNGPLAMIPLWDDYASIVWSTTPEEAELMKRMTENDLCQKLNSALQSQPISPTSALRNIPLLGTVLDEATGVVNGLTSLIAMNENEGEAPILPEITGTVGPRLGFDLSLSQSRTYVAPRLALVGDAAHSLHPMSGQGLNMGLADVDCLARVIVEGANAGADLGSLRLLETYNRERHPRNLSLMGGLEILNRMFTARDGPSALVRNAGMAMIESAGPVKKVITRVAMGI